MTDIDLKLCTYIADYIQEEFSRGVTKAEIDKFTIFQAIDAYQDGLVLGEDEEES